MSKHSTKRPTTRPDKRLAKSDWLDLGLKTLAAQGSGGIRIDNLCVLAARSKGSFYHHFTGREDFVAALLAYWEQELTQKIIDETERETTAIDKLIALNTLTSDSGSVVERELRRWAGHEPIVTEAIARVDKRRVKYVAGLFRQAKDISAQEAMDLAVMNYTTLVGFQQMFSPVPASRRKRIDQIFVDILTRLPNHK